jgi:Arc/MetJ-type ribon-helix-helix transcriptional regulator
MTTKTKPTATFGIRLTPPYIEKMDQIMSRTGIVSRAEVVRRALELMYANICIDAETVAQTKAMLAR